MSRAIELRLSTTKNPHLASGLKRVRPRPMSWIFWQICVNGAFMSKRPYSGRCRSSRRTFVFLGRCKPSRSLPAGRMRSSTQQSSTPRPKPPPRPRRHLNAEANDVIDRIYRMIAWKFLNEDTPITNNIPKMLKLMRSYGPDKNKVFVTNLAESPSDWGLLNFVLQQKSTRSL